MKDIKVNGKKLILKKIPLKKLRKFFEIAEEMNKLQGLDENAENANHVMEILEKAQNFLPEIYNLTKKEVEEFDMNDITLAISAVQYLMQEQQEKAQESMKEYVENFSKN